MIRALGQATVCCLVAVAAFTSSVCAASAPERRGDDSIFGAPQNPAEDAANHNASPPPQKSEAESRDEAGLREGDGKEAFDTEAGEPTDPLKIGGKLDLRSFASALQGSRFLDTRLSAPSLVDGYFDARPNDHIRGMLVARLQYDPTLVAGGSPNAGQLTTYPTPASNPSVALDQLWIRFDIANTVFVTVGQQHVKWGVSHFWTPTDYLSPQLKDPLAVFDTRLGTSMVKFHLPWEAKGWNFYAMGLLDNAGPANVLGQFGGAFRAEVVVLKAEIGAGAVLQRGRKPRLAFDFSREVGPIDVYAELALKKGTESPLYRLAAPPASSFGGGPIDFSTLFAPYQPSQESVATSGGASWTFPYAVNDTATLGAEYFYNSLGYSTSALYPWLIFQGVYRPFYTGMHYGGVYLSLPAPGNWDKVTFNFSTLSNLSDHSYISRVDCFIRVLSRMQVEAFTAVHYGQPGGEFRFALNLPPLLVNGQAIPATQILPPLIDFGLALRIDI